jgi:sugar phosphate isomerase/epimerase
MNRRQALRNLAALSALPYVAACDKQGDTMPKRRLEAIGIQLYTVRGPMVEDVRGTLARLAEIGYREVEFAGYFGYSPAEIRGMLDEFGLASPSAHVPIEMLRGDVIQVIDTLVEIGHEYLVVPWLNPEERSSLDKYRAHAELFNQVSEQCAAAGLGFAYHNHEFEFEPIDGILPIDLLLDETDPKLVQIELDLYWITLAGADPFAYFERHPGRFPLCHVKDMAADGSMTDVGTGQIDFAALFAASERAGFKHYYVERDDADDSLASAANSFAGISKIEF